MSKTDDELLHIRILSILNGNFKSMAADKLLQLITARDAEREAAIRKTERRKGIRDGYSYALTEIDIANDYVDAWKRVSAAHKKAVERCHD